MGVALATCFADSTSLADLHEMPIALTGSWVKDGHRFSITAEDLDDIVKNFEKRGNGEVVIDYEHASERPEIARGGPVPAAGWIKNLSVKQSDEGDGKILWAGVEWEKDAKKMLEDKKYKYFSPAIDWGANDKKTGRSKGATITSGALTNHPFLEELPTIQLSEGVKFADGKQIVVPVVDNAKIKVKIDSKHDDDKEKLAEVSLDQKRMAINEAIRAEYKDPLASDCCFESTPWCQEIFEDYVIVSSNGKLYKLTYKMDDKGDITLGKPVQVNIEYVEASELRLSEVEFSELHGKALADDGDDTKEGVHKSDYGFVGDPAKKSTWKYKLDTPGRVQNALSRWGQHKGIPKDKEPTVLRKIMRRAKKHGITVDKDNPKYKIAASDCARFGLKLSGGFLSEDTMKMTDKQFRDAILANVKLAEEAGKSAELCTDLKACLTSRYGTEKIGSEKQLAEHVIKLLDDIDSYGVEGDRGEQASLRKEAESRAAKVDKASDDDETETLRDKGKKDDDADDALEATDGKSKLPKFSIRKMTAEDGFGKAKHHAVIAPDGKLTGYIAHGDLMNHAKKSMEGSVKASDKEIEAILADKTGHPLTLSDVTKFVEIGISAKDTQEQVEKDKKSKEAHRLMLSEAVDEKGQFVERKVRRLLAEERVSQRDYADFQDAVEDVNRAIAEGRFLPAQRKALVQICLSDRKGFEMLTNAQPKSERTTRLGADVGPDGQTGQTPDQEVETRVNQLLKEDSKLAYKDAYSRVLASDKGLAERYAAAHRRVM